MANTLYIMNVIRKYFGIGILFCSTFSCATEILHPILAPRTQVSVDGSAEMLDDVYSADITLSAEYAFKNKVSLYTDVSFRFFSYSYDFSIRDGYIHNYCNLHVNGFNETYLGVKISPFERRGLMPLGLNLNWRFPPGEGSQKNRFQRIVIEPFYALQATSHLQLGAALRFIRFFEKDQFAPGDEIGGILSYSWKFHWNDKTNTGWTLDEILLWQARIRDSENIHMARPYRKMDDTYQGIKNLYALTRIFSVKGFTLRAGIHYEIHQGTLFGFETGHRLGVFIGMQ